MFLYYAYRILYPYGYKHYVKNYMEKRSMLMAEFCLDCFNKLINQNGKPLTEKDVILSNDRCEECQMCKLCVVVIKPKNFTGRIKRKYNITKYRLQSFIRNRKKSRY